MWGMYMVIYRLKISGYLFRVEERPSRTIQVISSTPADREKDVSLDVCQELL
jgi:hypothetical protein